METDSFFYQLLKQLPETLFALLGQPLTDVADYRFDALEVKKSYRLDGLFVPTRSDLPVFLSKCSFGGRGGSTRTCSPRCSPSWKPMIPNKNGWQSPFFRIGRPSRSI